VLCCAVLCCAVLCSDGEEDDVEPVSAQPTHVLVLPLYAMLSAEQQRRVFEPPPDGELA
jgi:HrpA-like RNA helicase